MLCNEVADQRQINRVRDALPYPRNITMSEQPSKNLSKTEDAQLQDAEEYSEPFASTPFDDVTEAEATKIQAWLNGSYAKQISHLKKQDEYVIAILSEFEKGNRDGVRHLFSKHPKPDELFLFFLDHWLLDPKEKAVNSAEIKHAPMKPYYNKARSQYSEEKAKNKRLTQEKFAERFSLLMQREFDAKQIEIEEDEKQLAAHIAMVEGVINTQKKILLKDEIRKMKEMLSLKRLHPEPPKVKAIASWLVGL